MRRLVFVLGAFAAVSVASTGTAHAKQVIIHNRALVYVAGLPIGIADGATFADCDNAIRTQACFLLEFTPETHLDVGDTNNGVSIKVNSEVTP